jgi:hypothetical protein
VFPAKEVKMKVVWRETSEMYDRMVTSTVLNEQGTARATYEVYRAGSDEWVDEVTVEALSLDKALALLSVVANDPAFSGWLKASE